MSTLALRQRRVFSPGPSGSPVQQDTELEDRNTDNLRERRVDDGAGLLFEHGSLNVALRALLAGRLALGALGPVRRERADAVSVPVCVVRHADRRELRCAPAERDELDDEDHEDGDERDRECVRLYGHDQRSVGQLKAGART